MTNYQTPTNGLMQPEEVDHKSLHHYQKSLLIKKIDRKQAGPPNGPPSLRRTAKIGRELRGRAAASVESSLGNEKSLDRVAELRLGRVAASVESSLGNGKMGNETRSSRATRPKNEK